MKRNLVKQKPTGKQQNPEARIINGHKQT